MKCKYCGYPVLPKYKACPHCGKSLTEDPLVVNTQPDTTYDVVNHCAIWNIQKGEIAHMISEREFETAAELEGVIVPEGCSAIAFVGKEVASVMQSGVYTFENDELLDIRPTRPKEKKPHAHKGGFWKGIKNFLFGKKKDEKPEQHQRRVERVAPKLDATDDIEQNLRVYLVSNRAINLLFDATLDEEGNIDFAPMVIPTQTVNVNISVALQLQVQNIAEVASNYLADSYTLRTIDLMQQLRATVKATLTNLLRNLDYQQEGLPEPIVNNLKQRLLQACNEQLAGIEATKVLNITDRSEDFERFRKLERDLYVNGKQLDYLQRTQAYKNRLEQQNNQQAIQQAQNAEELRKALQEVNHDKLLSESEMEQFTQMLAAQKQLREAKSKNEMFLALNELKKSQLVSQDEVKALEVTLEQKGIERDSVSDIMRVQAEHKLDMERQIVGFELYDNKADHERAEALKAAQHKGALLAEQLKTKRQLDEFADERKRQEQTLQQDMELDAAQHVGRMAAAKLNTKRQLDAYQDERQQHELETQLSAELKTAQNKTRVAAAQLDTKRQIDSYQDEREQHSFDQKVRNDKYAFEQQQRQREADFKQRVQNDNYDFEKRQREDLHQFEQDQRNFQTRVKNEDYDFEKRQREQALNEQQAQADYMRKRQDKLDDIDILERKAAVAQRNMQAMKQAELAELQERNRSAESIEQMQQATAMNRDNQLAHMDAEQIRAAQLSHLSTEAQVAMAQSYASNKESQLRAQQQADQQALYEKMLQQQAAQNAQSQETMMKMAQMMQQGMTSISQQQAQQQQQRIDDQRAMKDEYRENAILQQARIDHTQDVAMHHVSEVGTAVAANVSAFHNKSVSPSAEKQMPMPQKKVKRCPVCGAKVDELDQFCPECAARL